MALNRQTPPSSESGRLQQALASVLTFSINKADDLLIPVAALQAQAEEEVAFGRVTIDSNNLTPGMKLLVCRPAEAMMEQWRNARAEVDRLVQSKRADLDAVATLEAEVTKLKETRAEQVSQVERQLESDTRYIQVKDRFETAEHRWRERSNAHAGREANMLATTPLYFLILLVIGGAEYLINYHASLDFFGIPAIAFGSTVVLALLMALASHGYGTMLRQWSTRFGADREEGQRSSDWLLFSLSSFALVVMLAMTGWFRYQVAIKLVSAQLQPNILGQEVAVIVNPLRDVLVSLIANIAAWLVGVLFAFFMHDSDYVYMDATSQFRRATKAFNKARSASTAKIKQIEAKFAKSINEKGTAAEVRARSVEVERNVLVQVDSHGREIAIAVQRALDSNLDRYRDIISRLVGQKRGEVQFIRSGANEEVSPFEYRGMPLTYPVRSEAA